MSAEEAHEQTPPEMEPSAAGQDDDIDAALMDRIGSDARFDSGVPADQRGGDLDFVQMSGIALSPSRDDAEPPPITESASDAPLSFYEAGVVDVDGTMGPDGANEEDEVRGAVVSPSADSFRAIVEDLSAQAAPGAPEQQHTGESAAEVPSVDTTEPPETGDVPDAVTSDALPTSEEVSLPMKEAETNLADGLEVAPEEPGEEAPDPLGVDELDATSAEDAGDGGADSPEDAAESPVAEPFDDILGELRDAPSPSDATPDLAASLMEDVPETSAIEDLPHVSEELEPSEESATPQSDLDAFLETGPTEADATGDTSVLSDDVPEVSAIEELPQGLEEVEPPVEPATPDSDLDALLDAVPAEPESATSTDDAAAEAAADVAPPVHATDAQLAEAEQLLHELEEQPREIEAPASSTGEEAPRLVSDGPTPPIGDAEEAGEDEPELRYELMNQPARRRSRRHRARRKRRAIRWAVYAVLAVALLVGGGVGGWYGYHNVIRPTVGDPEELLREGRSLLYEGQFAAAADQFLLYARREPDGLARPDALFNAAYALQQVEGATTASERQDRLSRALQVLGEFTDDYPGHAKRGRADVLSGVVLMEQGAYDQAIEVLRGALVRTEDRLSQLPILRSLARAHKEIGQYDEAESMYLQAAVLPNNLTPEVDYDELGQLFQTLAQIAPDEETRQARLAKAATYWERAAETVGLSPDYRDELEERLAMLGEKPQVSPVAAAAPSAETETPAAAERASSDWEPNPTEEAKQLEAPLLDTE